MEEQLDLFDNIEVFDSSSTKEFDLISQEESVSDERKVDNLNPYLEQKIFYYKNQLLEKGVSTIFDLFNGFNTIKIITFSYNLSFLENILPLFDYAEILIGANHLASRDAKDLAALIMSVYDESVECVKKNKFLTDMLISGNCFIKSPKQIIDHRKIYLLQSDNGRSRVIISSANASLKSWSGEHLEHFEYDDTPEKYDLVEEEFNAIWRDSIDISEGDVTKFVSDDLDSAFIKKIKTVDKVVIAKPIETKEEIERLKFVYKLDKDIEKNKELLSGSQIKTNKQLIHLMSDKIVKAFNKNKQKLLKKRSIAIKEMDMPEYKIDFNSQSILFNNISLIEKSDDESIKSSIKAYLDIMNSYSDDYFFGDLKELKETHFRLLVYMFSSVFNSTVKYEAAFLDYTILGLKDFAILNSPGPDSGKTFMCELILKMMTDEEIAVIKGDNVNINFIRSIRSENKVMPPVIIDDLPSSNFKYYKGIIKNSDERDSVQLKSTPIVITSNEIFPDAAIRKRCVVFNYSAQLKSDVDRLKFNDSGILLKKNVSIHFFKEYLRRAIPQIIALIDKMNDKENNERIYPELVNITSKIIIDILKDYHFEIPDYMKVLSWSDDFGENAKNVAYNIYAEIISDYKKHPDLFTINKEDVIYENKSKEREFKQWKNLLPSEFKSDTSSTSTKAFFTFKREEFENRSGFKFKKSILSKFLGSFK